MLLCACCGKVIANVDPAHIRYGKCAACPMTEENIKMVKQMRGEKTDEQKSVVR